MQIVSWYVVHELDLSNVTHLYHMGGVGATMFFWKNYVPAYRKTLKPSWDPQLNGRKSHLKVRCCIEIRVPNLRVGEM